MPRGAKPGERRGGRKAGTPNRRTREARLQYRAEMDAAIAGKFVLAKDRVREIMELCRGFTAYYRPLDETGKARKTGNKTEFKEYLKLYFDAAKALAPFESPTLRTMMIQPPEPPPTREEREVVTLRVFNAQGELLRSQEILPPPSKGNGTGNGHG